jgi:hypothetical protein
MRLRPLFLMSAGLCGLAAFAAEPEKAFETPSTPGLRMPFAPRPDRRLSPKQGLRLPAAGALAVVAIPPGAGTCSVPLVIVLPAVPPFSRMPTLSPAPGRFATREVVLPAPPCPAGR